MNQSAIALPNVFRPNPSSSSEAAARPFFPDDSTTDRAQKIKQLLLDLSRQETDKDLKSVFRQTAEFFRESFFGLTEKQIRTRVKNCLEDYFDGEKYIALEIDNIAEETGIAAEKLLPVLERMVRAKILLQGRRRRFNEPGKHYNAIYCLVERKWLKNGIQKSKK